MIGVRAVANTNQGATIGASLSFTVPASALVNDLLYVIVATGTSGTGVTFSGTGTTGFTNRLALTFNANTNPTGMAVWYRFVTAGDTPGTTSYTWTMSASNHWGMCMLCLSGVDTVSPFDATLTTTLASANATSSAHPAITAVASNDLYIAASADRFTTNGATGTYSVSSGTLQASDNTTSGSTGNEGSTIATSQLVGSGAVTVPTTTWTSTASYCVLSDLIKASGSLRSGARSQLAPLRAAQQ